MESDDRIGTALGPLEPEDELGRVVERFARIRWRRATEWLRTWLTLKLIGLLVAAVGGVVLAAVSLPVVGGVLCGVVVGIALALAIVARRLLYREEARLRWMEIALVREEQAKLKAQNELDVAALALATGDQRALITRRPRHPELLSAVMRLLHEAAEARTRARPAPAGADPRRPAAPRPIDTKAIERRIALRSQELVTLEARVQSLADPTDVSARARAAKTREEHRAAQTAALEADREARERRRRGMPPTNQAGQEFSLEVAITPTGVRDVARKAPVPTPEEIAARGRSGRG